MRLKLVTGPTEEPVSLAEARLHLRVDESEDNSLIEVLIKASREYLEGVMRRSFLTQTWRLSLDQWPGTGEIRLPLAAPLQSVTSVVYTDSDGTAHTLSTDVYDVDTDSEPGRVALSYGQSWPTGTLATVNPIQITYVTGATAAASVPGTIKTAILLLVGHLYENREAVLVAQGVTMQQVPLAVESLIWLNRVF